MTGTYTTTYTRTQTATYLADVLMSSFASILEALGVDATRLYSDWVQDQAAISAWIAEQSLATVRIEFHQPSGVVDPIFVFPVQYTSVGKGDEVFVRDTAALAKYQAKLQSVPQGTVFKLFCTYLGTHSSQPGWSAATVTSLTGMTSRTIGTIGSGPHGAITAQVYRR